MSDLGPPEYISSQNGSRPASVLRAAPGLARIAVAAWWQTAQWTARASVKTTEAALRAAGNGMTPTEALQRTRSEVRNYARRLIGISGSPKTDPGRGGASAPLREQGAELLRRSADVYFREDTHPAYERILGDLAPDEARILRLLAIEGPQASVDVRTARPLGIGSELIAPGLTMIGAEAGARHPHQVPSYLNNLFRLGLVWFSREPVKSRSAYQVLEAQPDVIEATRKAGRAKTVRRSVHLTPFGEDFCAVAFDIDREADGELEEQPRSPE